MLSKYDYIVFGLVKSKTMEEIALEEVKETLKD